MGFTWIFTQKQITHKNPESFDANPTKMSSLTENETISKKASESVENKKQTKNQQKTTKSTGN